MKVSDNEGPPYITTKLKDLIQKKNTANKDY